MNLGELISFNASNQLQRTIQNRKNSTWIEIDHSHAQHTDVHDLLNGLMIDGGENT